MNFCTLFFSLIVATFMSSAHAMNNNLFEQGVHQRVERLLNIFNPTIKVFRTCSENLKENPGLENFQTNFEVINTAYKTMCEKIQDSSLLFEFMELKDSAEIKEKIETIKNYFDSFQDIISVNTPKYSLLNYADQKEEALKHIMNVFIKNKCHGEALASGNMETVASLFECKQEAFEGVEIVVEPDTADDENLAHQLQLKLNLELMREREVFEQRTHERHQVCEISEIEIIEHQEEVENLDNKQDEKKVSASIFSKARNDGQFIRDLVETVYELDITKDFDQSVFDRLIEQEPNNFSMLMNREIGRATSHDMMQHNFRELHIPLYEHYFPEFLELGYEPISNLKGHKKLVFCIKQLRNGHLASCSLDGTILIWNLDTEDNIIVLEKDESYIWYIKELQCGRLASCSSSNTINIWDLDAQKCVATLEGHNDCINCVTQLDDGRLVSCSNDGTIKVWNLNTKECLVTFKCNNPAYRIKKLRYARLASCHGDGTINIWNLNTKACVTTLRGHNGSITGLARLDDDRLASCSTDRTIKVWDLNTLGCIATLKGHNGSVSGVVQLDDGRLASCSGDKTIKIWNMNTEECIATIWAHKKWVSCIKKLKDGRLASGSTDRSIRIWDLNANLSLEQIALVVHLERYYQQEEVVDLGEDWLDVFETLPDHLLGRFEQSVS